jgi:hypothetical protein
MLLILNYLSKVDRSLTARKYDKDILIKDLNLIGHFQNAEQENVK